MTESEIHERFVDTYMHILKYVGGLRFSADPAV